MTNYFQGSSVRATGTFENELHVPTDPTVVSVVVEAPTGTKTTYTYPTDAQLVRDSAGVYHIDIGADTAGIWQWRMYGTGAVKASSQDTFFVIANNP